MTPAGADTGLERRARLAHIRQGLLAPVRAIVGYQEILLEEAQRLQLGDALQDMNRILAAAQSLDALVDRLLDFEAGQPGPGAGASEFRSKLRHDLRTPLNTVIGYGEMVLEELDGAAAEVLRPDIDRLLDEARQLLGLIDAIVDFSCREDRLPPVARDDSAAAESIVADLLRAIHPERSAARSEEVGRILVVDDNESNRDLLCRRLAHQGHEVTAAESGRRAMELLSEDGDVDLVLLDLMMPDMNGLEMLARLKADERWRGIPVIVISGLNETEAVIRCIEAGAEDYLPRPVSPVLLHARIGACLERKRWHDREREYLGRIEAEKARSDALLRNILPGQIIARLNSGETVIADRFDQVTILFADLVGFTPAAARLAPVRLVDRLNGIFSAFDALADRLGVEKIKTIGDAYMAAGGLPDPRADHAEAAVELAFGMVEALDRLNVGEDRPFQIRIGLHAGPVVAGIIGRHRFIYDVWGDTVNIASRLEAHGLPNRIQVSEAVCQALGGRYAFEPRGTIELRGVGHMPAFLLSRPRR